MRYGVLLAVGLFIMSGVIASAQTRCPQCYRFQEPLAGQGLHQGRLVLNVSNNFTFDDATPDVKIDHAIAGGMNKWNTTNDTTGKPSAYFFQATPPGGQPDFVFVKENDMSKPIARIDLTNYPHKIYLRSDAHAGMDVDCIAALVAHELGHRIGLANAGPNTRCPKANTIMRGYNSQTRCQVVVNVQPRDVFMSNRNFDPNPDTGRDTFCTALGDSGSVDTENDEHKDDEYCLDDDEDGVSTCEGDCDDYDAGYSFDCPYFYDPEPDYSYYYPYRCYHYYDCYDRYTCSEAEGVEGGGRTCRYQGTDCYHSHTMCY